MIPLSRIQIRFHFVNSGSPHCVIFLDENQRVGPDASKKLMFIVSGRKSEIIAIFFLKVRT